MGWQLVGWSEQSRGRERVCCAARAWMRKSRDQGLNRPPHFLMLPAVHATTPPPPLLTSALITQPLKAAWPAVDPETLCRP